MKKEAPIIKLNREHKQALATLAGRPEFSKFVDFLKTQQNNIAVLNWFRTPAEDPQLALKKKRYEGQFEMIKFILEAFEQAKKSENE